MTCCATRPLWSAKYRTFCTAFWLALPSLTAAQSADTALSTDVAPFENDYAAIFADHADNARVTAQNSRELMLPGPIRIVEMRDSDGVTHYYAFDENPAGAAGCTFAILIELTAITQICPGAVTTEQADVLAAALMQSAAFVATNTIPPLSPDALPTALTERVKAARDRLAAGPALCPQQSSPPSVQQMLAMASGPSFSAILDDIHATPRLPVATPCL